jgi:acyl-CoA thioesterase
MALEYCRSAARLVLPAPMGDFEQDTAVRAAANGTFSCHIRPDWWVVAGPNGGYVAAILVRAMSASAAAEERPLRSLTVHYQRAPQVGQARVEVTVEREGRSVSFLRASLSQDDRMCAAALAVFARDRSGMELDHAQAPAVPAPDEIESLPDRPEAPPFGREFEFRPAIGSTAFGGSHEALTGGWLRFRDERPLDASALVALCDSWFPAVFAVSDGPLAVPTLELTVHVRAPLPLPHDWVLGRYATRLAREGFLEEDAELFSRDGRLLAQSRQLALAG